MALEVVEHLELSERDSLTPAEERRLRSLDESIAGLLEVMLDEQTEKAAVDLIETLLAVYDPDALPRFERHVAEMDDLNAAARLHELSHALEMHMMLHGEYPADAQGLASLTAGDEPFLASYALVDAWKTPVRYTRGTPNGYEMRSAGQDRVFDNDDDYWTDATGEIQRGAGAGTATVDVGVSATAGGAVIGSLPRPGELWSLTTYADGRGVTYVAQRDEGTFIGFGDVERGPFDKIVRLAVGDVPGAAAYRVYRDNVQFLVTHDDEMAIDGHVTAAWMVAGTRIPHYVLDTDGKGTAWVGDKEMRFDGGVLEVGFTDGPILGGTANLTAYRERRSDGYYIHVRGDSRGPFEWASRPRMAIGDDGSAAVSYRVWDGVSTTFVRGSETTVCDWARDIVVSPRGQHQAHVEVSGGKPVKHFARDREREGREAAKNGFATTRAVYGGRSRLIVDGTPSPAYAFIEEPVFAVGAEDGALAFRAQDEEGRWRIVHFRGGEFTELPDYETVGRPSLDLDGVIAAHEATEDGTDYLCFGETSIEFEGTAQMTPGPNGRMALTLDRNEGIELATFDPNREPALTPSIGPFEDAGIAFLEGTEHVYAAGVDADGRTSIFTSSGKSGPLLPGLDNVRTTATGRVAFVSHGPDGYYPLVLDLIEQEAHVAPGAPFEAVSAPVILEDGTVGFEVDREQGPMAHPSGATGPWGFQSEVVTFGTRWSSVGPFKLSNFQGRGDRFAWSVYQDEHQVVMEMGRGAPRSGTPTGTVYELVQDPAGRTYFIAMTGAGKRVFGPERESGAYTDIDTLGFAPDSNVPVFRVERENGKSAWVIDWAEGPEFETIRGAPEWIGDGRYAAYVGNDGGARFGDNFVLGGTDTLVIVDLDAPDSPTLVEGDFVSQPTYGADQVSVHVAVLRGQEIVRIDIAR